MKTKEDLLSIARKGVNIQFESYSYKDMLEDSGLNQKEVDWLVKNTYPTVMESVDPNVHTDNVVVNACELASELAHKRVVEGGCQKIWEDEEAEQIKYTEEAQELFNEYYDAYKTIITGGKF